MVEGFIIFCALTWVVAHIIIKRTPGDDKVKQTFYRSRAHKKPDSDQTRDR